MTNCKRVAIVSALVAAFGVSPLAGANDLMRHAGPSLSESQMQGLSSEGPTWHSGDGSLYDESGHRTQAMSGSPSIPARDGIILPDDATNTLTPAEASRVTGHEDSAAGPPLNGSEEQAGNMGPNSSKGQ